VAYDQLQDFHDNVKLIYNHQRNGDPYQVGGLYDMVAGGQYLTAPSDGEVKALQKQYDRYIRDWLFLQVVGEQGGRMVILKQVRFGVVSGARGRSQSGTAIQQRSGLQERARPPAERAGQDMPASD
jgi:hypothetical protein